MNIQYKYKKLQATFRTWKHDKMYEKLDENQKLSYNIIKELISDKQSNLRIAPISGNLYIERDSFFVKIGFIRNEIKIVDGRYLFDVFLPREAIDYIRNHFNKRAEYKRIKFEEGIFRNIKVSLQLIHDHLLEDRELIDVKKSISKTELS